MISPKLPSGAEYIFPPLDTSSAVYLALDNGVMQIDPVSIPSLGLERPGVVLLVPGEGVPQRSQTRDEPPASLQTMTGSSQGQMNSANPQMHELQQMTVILSHSVLG